MSRLVNRVFALVSKRLSSKDEGLVGIISLDGRQWSLKRK